MITRFAHAAFSLYIWDSASLCQMAKPHPDDDVKQKIWRRYRINHLTEVQTERLAQMGAKSYRCLLTFNDCVANWFCVAVFPFVNFYRTKTCSVLEEPTWTLGSLLRSKSESRCMNLDDLDASNHTGQSSIMSKVCLSLVSWLVLVFWVSGVRCRPSDPCH